MKISYNIFEIDASAGTDTIQLAQNTRVYKIVTDGSVTLLNSYAVIAQETPIEDDQVEIEYEGSVTLNGNSITILGRTLSQSEALSKLRIIANYNEDTSSWAVSVSKDHTKSQYPGVASYTLLAAGGTKTLVPGVDKDTIYITGSPTLISGFSLTTGGSPVSGDTFKVIYAATPDTNAPPVSVSLFGVTLTEAQAESGQLWGITEYDGSAWRTRILKTVGFVDDANDLDDNMRYEVVTVPISFESSEQLGNATTGTNISLKYNFTLERVDYSVSKAIAGTDDASVAIGISSSLGSFGTSVTDGSFTITASTAIGTTATGCTPSANNNGTAAVNFIKIRHSKTTAGGKILLSLILKRKT